MSEPQVDILLATYNGERFLRTQLGSIFEQTFSHWHLYIRDDGSSDGTTAIIEEYLALHPGKITYLGSTNNGKGAKGNFSLLMQHSTAPYITFSDQDDEWLPDKIALTLSALRQTEAEQPETPCMVFSDLEMMDDNGEVFTRSLWQHDRLDPAKTSLSRLLVQNVPYGCAAMVNRSLLALATPVDDRALLHDHWMALLAAAAGRIAHLPQATIRHRIHGSNASRSANPLHQQKETGLADIAAGKNFNRYTGLLQAQAQAVLERLDQRNTAPVQREVLQDFAHLRGKFWVTRKWLMLKHGYFKQSPLQTLKWIIRI